MIYDYKIAAEITVPNTIASVLKLREASHTTNSNLALQHALHSRFQTLSQWLRYFGDRSLLPFVLGAADGCFDFDRWVVRVGRQIVRAGPHVNRASLHRQIKALQQNLAADPWHCFEGPLIQIHVRVDARWLL